MSHKTTPLQPNGDPSRLYVVTAVSNPARYASRYRLHEEWEKRVLDAGAVPLTVEVAFGSRPHEVSLPDNPHYLQLRTSHEFWCKENAINLGVARLPADWEYVACVDADVGFARPDWVCETLNQLQHFDVVQMFSAAEDLGPDFEPFGKHRGFVARVHDGGDIWGHPGYAWAIRREAFDKVGGLLDFAILGAADRHMALSFYGQVEKSIQEGMSGGYVRELLTWQERALELRGKVGFVPGTLYHFFHGKKSDRGYFSRWKALVDNAFDPRSDLKTDWQGLYQLAGNKPRLRDDLRAYFGSRMEDGEEVDNYLVPGHF